jgi:hypothetical protein
MTTTDTLLSPKTVASDPPPIPGFTFPNGETGQAAWINFASSYEVAPGSSGANINIQNIHAF